MTEVHEEYFIDSDISMIDDTFHNAPRRHEQQLNIMWANMIQKHIFNCYSYPFKKEIGYNNGLTLFICQIVSSLHNLRVKIHDLQKAFLNTIKKYNWPF